MADELAQPETGIAGKDGRFDIGGLLRILDSLIDRAIGAAKSLRRLIVWSGLFCVAGCLGLTIYAFVAGGIVLKVSLGLLLILALVLAVLLGIAWLALGLVASIETDIDDFSEEVAVILSDQLAAAPRIVDTQQNKGIRGKFRTLEFVGRFARKLRALGGAGKELAVALRKTAVLGNPMVNLGVLFLTVLGFILPFLGVIVILLRIWWRSKGG